MAYSVIDDYLESRRMQPVQQKIGPDYDSLITEPQQTQYASKPEAPAQAPQAGAASMAASGSPEMAAVQAGGSLITSYLAQRAADERARRERAAQIEDQYADNQNVGFNTQLKGLQGALR